MKFSLLLILAVLSFSVCDAPQQVLVIESAACGRCSRFVSYDLKDMVARKGYDQVVNVSILPMVHIVAKRNPDNSVTYSHQFGKEYLDKAVWQLCVNYNYSAEWALKWGANTIAKKCNLAETAKAFLTEDSGAKAIACATNPKSANEALAKGMDLYSKNRFGGYLPFIVLPDRKLYDPFKANFLDDMCRRHKDRSNLEACANVKYAPTELDFLSSEWESAERALEVPANPSTDVAFDYDKFWNSADDE